MSERPPDRNRDDHSKAGLDHLLTAVLDNLPGSTLVVVDRRLLVLMVTGSLSGAQIEDRAKVVGRSMSELITAADWVQLEPMLRASLAGEEQTREHSFVGDDRINWLRTCPLKTPTEKIYGAVLVSTDVTDQRVDELRRLRLDAQLERARRLEAVGKMAGGVAHDFNNLLAVVMNYTDFVAEALPGDSKLHADLAEIKRAAEKGASLTRQLLIFSRREVAKPGQVDLNEVVEHLGKLLSRTLGEDVRLDLLPSPGLSPVEADAGQVEQALVGMALNAREAMPNGGSLTIATENATVSADEANEFGQARAGDYVRISVSDTGLGIQPDMIDRIFDPFFTTKTRGAGTGLGLAAVHGVVASAGGHITVESEPGVGTTFKLDFPAAGDDEPPAETAETPKSAFTPIGDSPQAGKRILVAEDDESVRRVATRVLESDGFEVTGCADGQEAIDLLEEGQRFSLLLTDVVMPRVSGRELANLAAKIDAWMPVIYMSGYTEDIISSHDIVVEDMNLIRKPFTAADLLEGVKQALGFSAA